MLCKIDWSFFGTTIWPLVHMSDLKRPLFLPWFLVRVCVHWLLQNADVDADADFDVDFDFDAVWIFAVLFPAVGLFLFLFVFLSVFVFLFLATYQNDLMMSLVLILIHRCHHRDLFLLRIKTMPP